MKREDILSMAREAGLSFGLPPDAHKEQVEVVLKRLDRFAALVAERERDACGKTKSGPPRKLPQWGTGALWDEQQYCFEMGWREGAAAVRAAIRKRSNT